MAKELNGVRTASQWWAKGGVCVCRLRLWKYHSADMGTLIPRASSVLSNAVEVRGKTHILAQILAHGALVGQLAENGIHVVLISDRESQHEGPTGLWREREMS